MVPRFLWTFLAFVIYTVAGVAGREHFSEILSNFLSILSYWTAFFVVIAALEHFVFRRKGGPLNGYNLDEYDQIRKYDGFLKHQYETTLTIHLQTTDRICRHNRGMLWGCGGSPWYGSGKSLMKSCQIKH